MGVMAASFAVSGAARARQETPSLASPAPESAGLVSTYCLTCHNDRLKTGGLSLQGLGLDTVPEHAQVWEQVARKLHSGEMPPSTVRSRPDPLRCRRRRCVRVPIRARLPAW